MPHVCIRCKTRLTAATKQAPRCPECGGTKFSFESDRRVRTNRDTEASAKPDTPTVPDIIPDISLEAIIDEDRSEPSESDTSDSIESICIREPGKYDLNLLRLAESDDRVIRVGKDGNYRLDLHSMVRPKKK